MNYEQDLYIDENALDIEWLEQPKRMFSYCKHEANIQYKLDLLNEELDLLKSELDKKIRTDPEAFGIGKITENAVTSVINSQASYKEKYHEVLEMKFELNAAKGAVRAFDQRRKALENLVTLHGQQYFAGPSVPRNLSEFRELKQKSVDNKVARKLKRKS